MLEKTTIIRAVSSPSVLNNDSVSRKGVGSSAMSITTWRQYFDFDFRILNHNVQVDATLNGNNARLGAGRFRYHSGENVEAVSSKMYSSSSMGRSVILAITYQKVSSLRRMQLVETRFGACSGAP